MEAAVKADLADAEKRLKGSSRSGLAATLLELARQMDGSNSATSKSMCAKALFEGLDRLRASTPERSERNPLVDIRAALEDEVSARRDSKARSASASG